jgi:hypothetical protein
LRCDGDHKKALFCRVLQKMSAFHDRRDARSPLVKERKPAAYQHGDCGKQSTPLEESKGEVKKGAVAAGTV